MVRIELPKPVLDCDGVLVLMDKDFYEDTKYFLTKIKKEFKIRITDEDYNIVLNFKNNKQATMYRLKYGAEQKKIF